MGFFINAAKNKKRQKMIFLITAIFVAAGLVGSTIIGIFAGSSQEDYARAGYQAPQTPGQRVADLEDRLKKNPGDVEILGQLAEAYYDNGQVDKSFETYKKALDIDPDNSRLRTSLAIKYFLQDKPEDAVAQMREEIKQNPGNNMAHYYLGQFLAYGLGKYDQAVQELQIFLDGVGDSRVMAAEVAKARQMIEEFKDKS